MGYTWPYLVKLDYTWLNTLGRSLTCGPPSNRPHAFLRQTRNGLGFIENQEHVFCSQIESKGFKNCGLILYTDFVQRSLFFLMLWALQLNMHKVGYKCQTIHESGNWGDLWEKYKHHIHELENLGEIHDKQKHEIQEIGNLGEFMKNKNKFALWAAAAALHIWRFATKSTTRPKYPETVLFAKRSWKF